MPKKYPRGFFKMCERRKNHTNPPTSRPVNPSHTLSHTFSIHPFNLNLLPRLPKAHLAHEGDAVEVESIGALLGRAEFHERVLVVDAAGHHRVAGRGGEVNLLVHF